MSQTRRRQARLRVFELPRNAATGIPRRLCSLLRLCIATMSRLPDFCFMRFKPAHQDRKPLK
jgi:hypothetical protein